MKKVYEVVADSNVIIAALRSRRGASYKFLSLIGAGSFDIHISVPLVLEYEELAKRLQWKGKPPWKSITDILDFVCASGRQRKIHYLWRPRLPDSSDDMVLEVAVAGHCDYIITYNKRHFADAKSFGIGLLTPREFLKMTGELT